MIGGSKHILILFFVVVLLIPISSNAGSETNTNVETSEFKDGHNITGDKNTSDSDGDGYLDQTELNSGSDPGDINSTPLDLDGDGVPNKIDEYPKDPMRWEKEDLKYYFLGSYLIVILLLLILIYVIYTRINQLNALDHYVRADVYDYIREHPGVYSKEISERLNINKNTLRYHLKNLRYTGHIREIKVGKFKYFYTTDYVAPLFLSPIQKEIVNQLRQNGGLTTRELASKLGKARQTMHYHVKNLRNMKVVINGKILNNKVYWFLNNDVIDMYTF